MGSLPTRPLPPPLGEVVPGCLQPGTGRGCHPEEARPTKDPDSAGLDSGISMDIRTAPRHRRRGRPPDVPAA